MRALKVVSALLLALTLLSACSEEPVETYVNSGPVLPSFDDRPVSIRKADLSAQELTWLADLQRLKAQRMDQSLDPNVGAGGSYGANKDLWVTYPGMPDKIRIVAVNDEGRGVGYNSVTGQDVIIRPYAPSSQAQSYFEVLFPALEAWNADHGYGPVLGWYRGEWVLQTQPCWIKQEGDCAGHITETVVLDLPETFMAGHHGDYSGSDDGGYYYLTDEETWEVIKVYVEYGEIVSVSSQGAIPIEY